MDTTPTPAGKSGSSSAVESFLERYWKDREAGNSRTLDEYLALFPGDTEGVAAEYLALKRQARGLEPAGDGQLGRYRTIRELGRGGQAVVYLAEDMRLRRHVALKVLTGLGPGADPLLARFRREAEIASRLDHPGICTVLDTGIENGIPFIAMKYVEGETLARKIVTEKERPLTESRTCVILPEPIEADAQRLSPGETPSLARPPDRNDVLRVVRLVENVARAVHVAHEAGVIHRDLKPANIMVTATAHPVILDFGLARTTEGDAPSITRTGDLFGTPAYMSPEQITRQTLRVDHRTDIWSLGVTLYECLTLRRPFEGESKTGVYNSILFKDPPDPRRTNPAITKDLNAVILSAIEKDPDARYQTAAALADDLHRVLLDEPVTTRKGFGNRGRIALGAFRRRLIAPRSWGRRIGLSLITLAFGQMGIHCFILGYHGLGFVRLVLGYGAFSFFFWSIQQDPPEFMGLGMLLLVPFGVWGWIDAFRIASGHLRARPPWWMADEPGPRKPTG